ncbi:MAG TPA: PaaI family thioesterase [Roseiarcus sp.]|nr:PaaI family thioesterase [Roseiarcus sp.]
MGAIFGAKIPFAELCGIEFHGAKNGVTQLSVRLEPQHANNSGIPHGGLVATLMDIAMGSAARLAAGGPVMTLDMHISFFASGEGSLSAEGRVMRAGVSVIFCEAEARDANGELVAKSSGVFKRRKSAGGASEG